MHYIMYNNIMPTMHIFMLIIDKASLANGTTFDPAITFFKDMWNIVQGKRLSFAIAWRVGYYVTLKCSESLKNVPTSIGRLLAAKICEKALKHQVSRDDTSDSHSSSSPFHRPNIPSFHRHLDQMLGVTPMKSTIEQNFMFHKLTLLILQYWQ